MDFYFAPPSPERSTLCSRCKKLKISKFCTRRPSGIAVNSAFDTYHSSGEDSSDYEDDRYIPLPKQNLGPANKLVKQEDCPLCEFLDALLPSSARDSCEDIYLLFNLAIHRFEPMVHSWTALGDNEPKEGDPECDNFGDATYLYLAQKLDGPFPSADTAHDAFTHTRESLVSRSTGMLARRVDPTAVDKLRVVRWIDHCKRFHGAICNPGPAPELQGIRLIDVHQRRIVQYECQYKYFCLSYVWGKTKMPLIEVKTELPTLPATIGDAISFVKSIGQRYLWIDSICIDQADSNDKTAQIAIMDKIYKGAWVTIVALSGDSADSGLPRVSFPGESTQLEFSHRGLQLLTVMSTLKQQIRKYCWSERAWTYQEAVLSPRCLYFTPEQVYYSCNMTQFCESIEEEGSAFHKMRYDEVIENLKYDRFTELGDGVFRDPSSTPFELKVPSRWQILSDLIREYSSRKMTYDSDGHNAVSAILMALENSLFRKGFFWGLPLEGFPYALAPGTSSEKLVRREGLPSWSWLGWKGSVYRTATSLWTDGSFYVAPPPLKLLKWNQYDKRLDVIFESNHMDRISNVRYGDFTRKVERWSSKLGVDPIIDIISDIPTESTYGLEFDHIPEHIRGNVLFIQGLIFQPKARYVSELFVPPDESEMGAKLSRRTSINGIACLLTCDNPAVAATAGKDPEGSLFPKNQILLLFRRSNICAHHFLLLETLRDDYKDANDNVPATARGSQLRAQRVGSITILTNSPEAMGNTYLQFLTDGAYEWRMVQPVPPVPTELNVHVFRNQGANADLRTMFPEGSLEYKSIALE